MSDPSVAQPFRLERPFKASCDQLFQAWTDADLLRRWFAPVGMMISQAQMDLQPGGAFLYALKAPVGLEMWGKWVFQEITPPNSLTFIQHFSDAAGSVTRHPLSLTWPLQTLTVASFEAKGEAALMRITSTPLSPTPAEIVTFNAAQPLMQQAWTGTLDQLERYLAE
jgi:uncharacterized protein YndB with AHSA1/START domain